MQESDEEPTVFTPKEWIDYMYQHLRPHITASDPVGSDETGWIVELGIDYPPEKLAAELDESLAGDRGSLSTLLAAVTLAYVVERANSEAGPGQRTGEA